MVVKTVKWSPWQPAASTESRKFRVVVKPMKLEGFDHKVAEEEGKLDGDHHRREKTMVVKMRWKGEVKPGLVSFHRGSRQYKECSEERFVRKGKPIVWDEEFENECNFTVVLRDVDDKFLPWDVSFKLLHGEYRAKKSVIGKVSLNLAGITSKKSPSVTKLPVDLHIAGTTRKATLSVLVIFMELKDPRDPPSLVRNSSWFGSMAQNGSMTNNYSTKNEMISLYNSNESGSSETWSTPTESQSSSSSNSDGRQMELVKKVGFFSWKRRRLSIRHGHTKVEPVSISGPLQGANSIVPDGPKKQDENLMRGSNWEAMKLTSRDGQTKLKSNVFFASFDQRSNKAAGESACTALVSVIAHWMQSNQDTMPTRTEFDNLIIDGSSEWRNLCGIEAYVNQFPNKHFDLETVLGAGIRPITVSPQRSFVGFFNPEKFESLKGAMSFDEIWNEIERHCQEDADEGVSRIYLVSWNDHFFVLKADVNAYYIIDTLGERLYEGCNQAYILRFDENSSLTHRGKKENEERTYSGKICCREFIKRFLAAIPLGELEEEEKKAVVPYYSLHNRLQIEFNFSTPLPSSTYLFSSSAATSR